MFGKGTGVTNPQAVLPIIRDISLYLRTPPRPFFSGVCFGIVRKEKKNCVCGGGQFINLPIEASSLLFFIYIERESGKFLCFYERANSFIWKPVSWTGSLIPPMIYLGDS